MLGIFYGKNTFTNSQGLSEIPQSTNFIIKHKFKASEQGREKIEIDSYVPFGNIVKQKLLEFTMKINPMN